MKKIIINFLIVINFLILGNVAISQSLKNVNYPVLEKLFWFTTGIETKGSDLLLHNPTVFSEIIAVDCDRTLAYKITQKFEAFFEAKHAASQGVTGIYLEPFAFLTFEEAEVKRNELKANVARNTNTEIYLVDDFKANCE